MLPSFILQPMLPPYAWGAGYVISFDCAAYIAKNLPFLWPGLIRGCGNVEDVQVGLWFFAAGVDPSHSSRFGSYTSCHRRRLVLFDVPPELMGSLTERPRASGICTPQVRMAAMTRLEAEINRKDSAQLQNSAALQHALLVRARLSSFITIS